MSRLWCSPTKRQLPRLKICSRFKPRGAWKFTFSKHAGSGALPPAVVEKAYAVRGRSTRHRPGVPHVPRSSVPCIRSSSTGFRTRTPSRTTSWRSSFLSFRVSAGLSSFVVIRSSDVLVLLSRFRFGVRFEHHTIQTSRENVFHRASCKSSKLPLVKRPRTLTRPAAAQRMTPRQERNQLLRVRPTL